MTDNGRNEPRYRCRLRVNYKVGDAPQHAGFTTDVGPHGLFVLASPAPAPGRQVRLDVSLPDGGSQALTGSITWSRQGRPHPGLMRGGFGVRLDMPTEDWYSLVIGLASDGSAQLD